MLDPIQFRDLIIVPTLRGLAHYEPCLYSAVAVNLLLGTALAESGLRDLKQRGGGPALGLYQMEPATYYDTMTWLRSQRPVWWENLMNEYQGEPSPNQLIGDLPLATAMARLKYWRDPEPLPVADDILGLASMWKRIYNTPAGAGRIEHFMGGLKKQWLLLPDTALVA